MGELRRRGIASQPHLVTASGETLGIAVAEPKIQRLAVTFSPVQSGSGTPSPSNVRPISGWSSISVALGSQTASISLGGTYYGGTVDLVSGVMTVNRAYVLFDGSSDEAWNQESLSVAGTNFYINIPSASGFSYDVLCNMADKRTSGGNYQQGTCYISAAKNFNIAIGDLISVTTASAFKTWLSTHNVQLVYQITSQTVTLTPQTIAAMRGQQTVTSPAGAVEISYWTH